MKETEFRIAGLTMAIFNMDQMLGFYSNVFGVEFEQKDMYGSKLYSGKWGGFDLLFCPAEIARNEAKQNRHQFEIVVTDLDGFIEGVRRHNGETMGDQIAEDSESKSIGVYDPDRNSIIIKQFKD